MANFNKSQVARMLGMDTSNYCKYESGKYQLSTDMLVKLAEIFDVSADYLLGIKDI